MILLPMGVALLVLGLILLVTVSLALGLVVLAAGFVLAVAAMPFAGRGPWSPFGDREDVVVVRRRRPARVVRRTVTHVVEDDGPGPPAGPIL
jgi:hypothetical protein